MTDRPATPSPAVRPAHSAWPELNAQLIGAVSGLTEAQLAVQPAPDRWPLWATVGHLACQRVFWLCDFAGEAGAATTPFTNASYLCPGDDDLEHAFDGPALADALTSTFRIVEGCLDRWTLDSLAEEIRRPDLGPDWVKTRGAVLERVARHDVIHAAEIHDILVLQGLPGLRLWP